jgi:DNA-binding winged helix-turn-helix (wHTH) protein
MGQEDARARRARAIRCGVYEIDFAAGELRKNGFKVPLQEQPFRVLARLLAHPGRVATREELQGQLWGEDSLVDAELGLNTAIKKLRAAFGDSADNPRFIETLPKRGYRFIAPVQEMVPDTSVNALAAAEPRPGNVDEVAERASAKDHVEVRIADPSNGPRPRAEEPNADKASAKQNFDQADATRSERSSEGRSGNIDDFIPPASVAHSPRRRYLAWSFLFALLVIIAAAGIPSALTGVTSLETVAGHVATNKGISIYRSIRGPAQSATGIGGYDLRSRGDQAFAFDYDHNGKLDHLVLYRPGTGIIWIMKNSGGVFSSAYEGSGLGGYELKSGADRVIAFDYEHSGKLDYLVLFRLGTDIIWVVKNNGEGIFTPVYQPSDKDGAPPTEDSNSPTDQTFAFDYNHTGKLDHLVRCKPNTGTMEIWTNSEGSFSRVRTIYLTGDGDAPHHSGPTAGQAFAFDYDHTGKLDHIVLYRPGSGMVSIFKNSEGTFTPVFQGEGIGGFDLKSPNDRALAFDYDHTGRLDHLLFYRAGVGTVSILKNTGGSFAPIYAGSGIGGYDLKSANDRALAFDYDHTGKLDHLALYRPGTGIVHIARIP